MQMLSQHRRHHRHDNSGRIMRSRKTREGVLVAVSAGEEQRGGQRTAMASSDLWEGHGKDVASASASAAAKSWWSLLWGGPERALTLAGWRLVIVSEPQNFIIFLKHARGARSNNPETRGWSRRETPHMYIDQPVLTSRSASLIVYLQRRQILPCLCQVSSRRNTQKEN